MSRDEYKPERIAILEERRRDAAESEASIEDKLVNHGSVILNPYGSTVSAKRGSFFMLPIARRVVNILVRLGQEVPSLTSPLSNVSTFDG